MIGKQLPAGEQAERGKEKSGREGGLAEGCSVRECAPLREHLEVVTLSRHSQKRQWQLPRLESHASTMTGTFP